MAHWLTSFHNLIPEICFAGRDSTVLNNSNENYKPGFENDSDVRFAEPSRYLNFTNGD